MVFSAPKKVDSVLHIAPEEQLSKKIHGLNLKNYVCGDLFAEGYVYPTHVQNISILDIPFSENSFDLTCGFKVTRASMPVEYLRWGLNQDEQIFVCEK